MVNAIDVSKWQGAVNWAAVKKAGVIHAMLRAGYGGYVSQKDPQFDRNVQQCEANGIAWGCYWYSYATSAAQARQEALCCLQVIKGMKPTMPVAYDIEYEPGILALTNAQRTELVKAFLGEIEAAGYYGMLYASRDFIANKLNYKDLARYDVWCAQYGSKCTCPLPYGIWQYSSKNALGIPGYGNSLDCDHVYKDYPSIIKAAGLNGFAKTAQTPSAPDTNTEPDDSATNQMLTIGPVSNGDASTLEALCAELDLTSRQLYHSDWADADHMTQMLAIGPVSSGDAWRIMQECKRLQLTDMGLYTSKSV